MDNKFFYGTGGGNYSEFTVPNNFTVDQVSNNITYATSTDGDLWKFTTSSGSLDKYYTPPHPFPMGASLLTAGSRIGLGKTNTTSAWFLGL